MPFKVVRRLDSVLVFERDGDTNYIGSFQVSVFGDKGIVTDLESERFYELMLVEGAAVMKALGITRFEGYVKPGHERLVRYKLRRIATVDILHAGKVAGLDVLWIVIKGK